MEDQNILNLSRSIFWVCFSMGTIFLLGGLMTRQDDFVVGGYLLLVLAAPLNLLFALGFLVYGIIHRSKFIVCLKAIGILCINIPIAILYTIIGYNLIF
ncbi:hypothetical protein F3J23_19265 [Chryseobacterium sp. Tr-659]|uniref:hypothetical protein n=1 Tax=Chryseobacterium sp. Tr-659 TaxID=2608340 RepID=UPI00141EB709|nr:hypothetical protein [Chryseobacterium sp. Tr-659]NIF07566.1 hypothetical protein [Chryseobacterium sp. Tr-659]